jgi:quinol monooxygenase YgiN
MLATIATIHTKEGAEEAFLTVAKELVAAVNANELGCQFYQIYKGDEPQTFYFIERYENEAATEAHRASDHFKTIGARMGPFMAGRPDVLRLREA